MAALGAVERRGQIHSATVVEGYGRSDRAQDPLAST